MEYMGELNFLEWTGDYFIQLPSGFKEKNLYKHNIMEIIRDTITSKEVKELEDMTSISTSFPLTKRTAKEVMGKIARDAADEGLNFLVNTLIETTLDIDMGTNKKPSIFGELFKIAMDEEERSYIAAIGKYEKNELFFESVIPTSEVIQAYFHTEYEADFFIAHVALDTYDKTQNFDIQHLEDAFKTQLLNQKSVFEKDTTLTFSYHDKNYPLQCLATLKLSYNPFKTEIDLT